ncbi:MAG: LamG-like jellyroll fold domain-containing protein [Patescibacteria group bacterium]|nr:LamG domain-containing protein [Patescibacteria group bacterium]
MIRRASKKTIAVIIFFTAVLFLNNFSFFPVGANSLDYAIFFNGTGTNQKDRIKIPLTDQQGQSLPVNVGMDFTVEFWLKGFLADNKSTSANCGGYNWIHGNIIADRDIYGAGDYGDWGVSVHNGKVRFGVGDQSSDQTICGQTNILDGNWHHLAVTRRTDNGRMAIFIDGQLTASGTGPVGNISYRAGRLTNWPQTDPYLVLGAEKHDAGTAYPSFKGWFDEFRLSNVVRYNENFQRPETPFTSDSQTVLLYHLNQGGGTGEIIQDESGYGITGDLKEGSVWRVSDSPLTTAVVSPTLFYLRGDVNRDGRVDRFDALLIFQNFGRETFSLTGYWDPLADNRVAAMDFSFVLNDWQK